MEIGDRDDFRTVVEDARARHAAIIALIYFTDTQAMNLLRLYLTLCIATVTGAATIFANPALATYKSVGWSLLAASLALILGAILCMHAMRSGKINLPGRGADFWLWALQPRTTRTQALVGYLESLVEKGALNDQVSAENARALTAAKWCSVLAPIAAIIVLCALSLP